MSDPARSNPFTAPVSKSFVALAFALLPVSLVVQAPAHAESRVLSLGFQAFGSDGEIRTVVRDLPPGADPKGKAPALDAALAAIRAFEERLGKLQLGDGTPHAYDAETLALLERAQGACFWSEGILAPFGRGPGLPAKGPQPDGPPSCFRISIDKKKGTATLTPGAAVDLREMAAGYAVDLAIQALRADSSGGAGPDNGWVRLGSVQRSFGADLRSGAGKWVDPPAAIRRLDPDFRGFYLSDRALAVAASNDEPPHLDQRTGVVPPPGLLVLAVTDLALDAQILSATLLVAGSRGGELLLGSVRPNPSILWVYGSGNGLPLYVEHAWSALQRKAP